MIDLSAAIRDSAIRAAFADMAIAAGAIAMNWRGRCAVDLKADASPVTIADQEAEALILDRLHALLPGVPIVSEEAAAAGKADVPGRNFILVDALDGTKEFIAGTDEFTVNIGLIHDRVPVGGVIYAPALARLWLAGDIAETCDVGHERSFAAARNLRRIRARSAPAAGLTAAISLRHNSPEAEALLARFPIAERVPAGSSLKFCRIAEGLADFYPRFTPTMEWDTSAGQAVVQAAGGAVVTPDGKPLRYNKRKAGFRNGGFIVVGDRALLSRLPRAAD